MDVVWQILLVILAIILSGSFIFKIYLYCIKGVCISTVSLKGKVAIVTGANTGIGYFTALDFARRNGRVILACRTVSRGEAAAEKIKKETGNTNIEVMKCDLSLMKSVREFVEAFKSKEKRLDILVNNAGMAGVPLTMTEEGFELMFASNHFGHFLLTNLLLDLLKKSTPSRVVNVSSLAHTWSKGLDFENLRAEKSYDIGRWYFDTKLANILFTRELAKRLEGTGVTSFSVHPGVVLTEVWRNVPLHNQIGLAILKLFMKTSEEGAQTSIYCSISEEATGHSGKYFMDCHEADNKASDMSKDMGLAKKLWEVSEKLTGLA